MKINWAQKLSSRKLWSLILAQAVALCILLNMDSNHTAQIVAVIGNFGSIIMYMLSEAKVDAARATNLSA